LAVYASLSKVLILQRNDFVNTGPFGGVWGENKTAPTFSAAITATQIKNRHFLLIAATQAGLVNYPCEFWYFSSGDR
jgi:hypothetical protein